MSIQAIEPHEGTAILILLAAVARTDRAVAKPWISVMFCALIIGAPTVTDLAMAGHVRGNIALELTVQAANQGTQQEGRSTWISCT